MTPGWRETRGKGGRGFVRRETEGERARMW
jgi:hypothetical protein